MRNFTLHRLCRGAGLLCYCLLLSNSLQAQEQMILKEIRKDATTHWAQETKDVRADRPLIGIYAGSDEKGIAVDNIVTGGGAAAAGLKAGDVITSIDGAPVRNMHDLEVALSRYEGGRQVAVQYLRDGQARQANVTLKDRPVIREDRPVIGIYPEDNNGSGIRIDDITAGGGAVEGGMKSGDVITRINTTDINSVTDLKAELSKYKAGDQVNVTYLRADQPQQTRITLKERTEESNWMRERNPCAVFIGVSLSGSGENGRGVHISGIIDDTPAQTSGVQAGDDILALDDVRVNTFNELLHERNKHQPGDFFTLTVLRDGREMDIETQFKSCAEEETAREEPAEEEAVEEIRSPQEDIIIDNSLKVEQWRAYPNPAFGNLNVQFQAEPVPTSVQIFDANGRSVYRETLNQFDGYYNQQIDLDGIPPGNYYLQVRQGDGFVTEKIVVMPRA